jgi:hypothetical protein
MVESLGGDIRCLERCGTSLKASTLIVLRGLTIPDSFHYTPFIKLVLKIKIQQYEALGSSSGYRHRQIGSERCPYTQFPRERSPCQVPCCIFELPSYNDRNGK